MQGKKPEDGFDSVGSDRPPASGDMPTVLHKGERAPSMDSDQLILMVCSLHATVWLRCC